MCESVRVEGANDPSVVQERVRARSEGPGGVAELGVRRVQRGALVTTDALEVPPAASIAREHEVARRAPLGLPDRLGAVRAGDMLDVGEIAVRSEVGDVQLAAVPRHPGQVPGEEAQTRAVG